MERKSEAKPVRTTHLYNYIYTNLYTPDFLGVCVCVCVCVCGVCEMRAYTKYMSVF